MDVCPINGTLVAAGGWDQNIKIYDRRSAGISKKFNPVHKRKETAYNKLRPHTEYF